MATDRQLVRGLGRLEATTLVVGGIIGTTIFLVTSEVAATVGSPALVLVTWLASGLLAGAAALCFAELSAAMPATGGTDRGPAGAGASRRATPAPPARP